MRVTVLYEDQSHKGLVKDFGLHALLLACLADEIGDHEQRRVLANRVTANLKKGNEKLYTACADEVPILTSDGSLAIALFDTDRLQDMTRIPKGATESEVLDHIRNLAPAANLIALPLRKNLESVIRAAVKCDPSLAAKAQPALEKSLNERDKFFQGIAAAPSRTLRDCILSKVESLKTLRDRVLHFLQL